MYEFTQLAWAMALVATPVALAVVVVRLVWRNGGLPVPETMALLESMVEKHERTESRVAALEHRLHKLDGVVPIRGRR